MNRRGWVWQFCMIRCVMMTCQAGFLLYIMFMYIKYMQHRVQICTCVTHYLALINRAGGLYGRMLTEVVSADRTQWGLAHDWGQDSPIQTNLAQLIRCLLYGKDKNNWIHLMWLVCTDWCFAWERHLAKFNSSEVYASSLLFFSSAFWHVQK